MKKVILIFLSLLIMLFIGCSSKTNKSDNDISKPDTSEITKIAQSYIQDFLNQEFNKLYYEYNYTDKMKKAVSPEIYQSIYDKVEKDFGKYISTKTTVNSQSQGFQIITIITEFEKNLLNLNVVFDEENIGGFNYTVNKNFQESKENNTALQVEFGKEPYIIKGELNIPEGNDKFPAVIIVHGSGPVDRNGSVLSSTPYKDLSEDLVTKGIAVLTYDKRTYTYSKELASNIDSFTVYEETIEDVVYALNFLKNNEKIDDNNIFIIGHSFGGYLMPRIMEKTADAKGYIVMAGNVSPLEDLIIKQYNYLFNLDGKISEDEQNQLNQIEHEVEKINNLDKYKDELILGIGYAYWNDLKNYNPVTKIKEFNKPVLILQGERDYQVTMEEFNKWQNSLKDLKNFSFKTYKSLNHLFISGEGTPTPEEYNKGDSVSEEVIGDIKNFIENNIQ